MGQRMFRADLKETLVKIEAPANLDGPSSGFRRGRKGPPTFLGW